MKERVFAFRVNFSADWLESSHALFEMGFYDSNSGHKGGLRGFIEATEPQGPKQEPFNWIDANQRTQRRMK